MFHLSTGVVDPNYGNTVFRFTLGHFVRWLSYLLHCQAIRNPQSSIQCNSPSSIRATFNSTKFPICSNGFGSTFSIFCCARVRSRCLSLNTWEDGPSEYGYKDALYATLKPDGHGSLVNHTLFLKGHSGATLPLVFFTSIRFCCQLDGVARMRGYNVISLPFPRNWVYRFLIKVIPIIKPPILRSLWYDVIYLYTTQLHTGTWLVELAPPP